MFTGVETIKTCDIAKLLLIKYNILYSLKYLRNIAKRSLVMNKEIPKILVADDNPEIREIVEILLTGEGYEVIMATNGEEAVNLVDSTIDLIILDVVMPVKTGFVACNEIREKTTAPILFLTAKTQDSDKVIGFSAGGDDYLSKPFSYSELISRVKSLLRRYYIYQGKEKEREPNILKTKELCVNLDTQDVTLNGEPVFLTTIEYSILILMLKNRKKFFRLKIYMKLFGMSSIFIQQIIQ